MTTDQRNRMAALFDDQDGGTHGGPLSQAVDACCPSAALPTISAALGLLGNDCGAFTFFGDDDFASLLRPMGAKRKVEEEPGDEEEEVEDDDAEDDDAEDEEDEEDDDLDDDEEDDEDDEDEDDEDDEFDDPDEDDDYDEDDEDFEEEDE